MNLAPETQPQPRVSPPSLPRYHAQHQSLPSQPETAVRHFQRACALTITAALASAPQLHTLNYQLAISPPIRLNPSSPSHHPLPPPPLHFLSSTTTGTWE